MSGSNERPPPLSTLRPLPRDVRLARPTEPLPPPPGRSTLARLEPLALEPRTAQTGPARSRQPAPPPDYNDADADPYTDLTATEPPLEPLAQMRAGARTTAAAREDEFYAPSRTQRSDRSQANVPIIEGRSVTGRSLTLVIAIMCCLACLTAGAVYLMNQSASAWLRDIASEVTAQIEPRDKTDTEKVLREVAAFIGQSRGIHSAKPLSLDESTALLEPWLGQSDVLKSLPVPRLIAIELDRTNPPDLSQLRQALAARFQGVTLDDHRQWQQQIRAVTRSFALGGLAILMLVGAATTAVIVSATRSAMASNRDIVEVLHFVGATDRFIAREFERHFLRLGVRAGVVGAGLAMAVFLAMPYAMQVLGGNAISMAELHRLLGSGVLDLAGFALLAIVVFVIAALCMLTSRIGVYRILNSQH